MKFEEDKFYRLKPMPQVLAEGGRIDNHGYLLVGDHYVFSKNVQVIFGNRVKVRSGRLYLEGRDTCIASMGSSYESGQKFIDLFAIDDTIQTDCNFNFGLFS